MNRSNAATTRARTQSDNEPGRVRPVQPGSLKNQGPTSVKRRAVERVVNSLSIIPVHVLVQQVWSLVGLVVVQGYLDEAAPFAVLGLFHRLCQGWRSAGNGPMKSFLKSDIMAVDSGKEQVTLPGKQAIRVEIGANSPLF